MPAQRADIGELDEDGERTVEFEPGAEQRRQLLRQRRQRRATRVYGECEFPDEAGRLSALLPALAKESG